METKVECQEALGCFAIPGANDVLKQGGKRMKGVYDLYMRALCRTIVLSMCLLQKQRQTHDMAAEKREFNMDAYQRRYVALEVLYTGWNYHGFASQADTQETVEVLID